MALRLVKAELADIPPLVDLYFDTFKSPLVLRLKPNIPPIRSWYRKNLESDIEKPHIQIYKVVEVEDRSTEATDKIIAFAKWSSPHTSSSHENLAELPVDGDVVLFEEVKRKVIEKETKVMGGEEYWYMAVLATLPEYQRRGVGSMLMTEFCKQADQTGHRSYVEASRLGRPIYERFGFETKDSFSVVIEGEPCTDYCMVREPQKRP